MSHHAFRESDHLRQGKRVKHAISYTVHTKPTAPAAATAHPQTPQTPCSRSTPESLSSGMPKNWHASDSNGHTQAGATPPQSQQCHAVEQARTRPATHKLQGSEHHLREENVIDVHETALETYGSAALDKELCSSHRSFQCLWLAPSFTSQAPPQGSGPDWPLSSRLHVKRVCRVVVVVLVLVLVSCCVLLCLVVFFLCLDDLRSRCSMEMRCLDDLGRDSWDWVGPPA